MLGQAHINSCPFPSIALKVGEPGIMDGFVGNIHAKASCPGAAFVLFSFAVFCLGKTAFTGRHSANIPVFNLANAAYPCQEFLTVLGKILSIGRCHADSGDDDSLVFCVSAHCYGNICRLSDVSGLLFSCALLLGIQLTYDKLKMSAKKW
jgi:hypothetical protein